MQYDSFFGTHTYCANTCRWHKLLLLKQPEEASIIFDYENLYFVLLWFALKSTLIAARKLPWAKVSNPIFGSYICVAKDFASKFIDAYCHTGAKPLLLLLYDCLWSKDVSETNCVSEFKLADCSYCGGLGRSTGKIHSSLSITCQTAHSNEAGKDGEREWQGKVAGKGRLIT